MDKLQELLTEKAPRVMTLEEVAGRVALDQDDHFWMEYGPISSNERKIIKIIPRNTWFVEGGIEWRTDDYCLDGVLFDEMNTVWRCWTDRPTDEQRKEAEWDGT